MKNKKILLIVFVCQLIMSCQNGKPSDEIYFEGKVIYSITFIKPRGSIIPQELFEKKFNQFEKSGTLFIRGSNLKFEITNENRSDLSEIFLFLNDSGKSYFKLVGSDTWCTIKEKKGQDEWTIKSNSNDTINVFNFNCAEKTIYSNNIVQCKLYVNENLKTTFSSKCEQQFVLFQAIQLSQSVPLSMTIPGNNGIFDIHFSAIQFDTSSVSQEIFDIPKFINRDGCNNFLWLNSFTKVN